MLSGCHSTGVWQVGQDTVVVMGFPVYLNDRHSRAGRNLSNQFSYQNLFSAI
ncbi:protein of unknown function [Kingella kingae]|nr:protein of unknown function [Kingella kingae]